MLVVGLAVAVGASRADAYSVTFSVVNGNVTASWNMADSGTPAMTVKLVAYKPNGDFLTDLTTWMRNGPTGGSGGFGPFGIGAGASVKLLQQNADGSTSTLDTAGDNAGSHTYPAPPTTQPVGSGNATAVVYATRPSATLGQIHIEKVTITAPWDTRNWMYQYYTQGEYRSAFVVVPFPTNSAILSYDLTGTGPGVAAGLSLIATDENGHAVYFWEGNLTFPEWTGTNTTQPTTFPGPGTNDGPTYGSNPGGITGGPASQPIGPTGTGSGGSGGGTGTGTGTGSGSGSGGGGFWSTSQPGTPGDPTGATTQGSGGDTFDARIASIKAKLAALGFDFGPLTPGGAVDMPVTVNGGDVGGTALSFTIRFLPDTSTDMGAKLASCVSIMRGVIACLVVYGMFQACIDLAKELL